MLNLIDLLYPVTTTTSAFLATCKRHGHTTPYHSVILSACITTLVSGALLCSQAPIVPKYMPTPPSPHSVESQTSTLREQLLRNQNTSRAGYWSSTKLGYILRRHDSCDDHCGMVYNSNQSTEDQACLCIQAELLIPIAWAPKYRFEDIAPGLEASHLPS